VLACHMDESSDAMQEKIFVVAGYLARTEIWYEVERQWAARLRCDGIEYFRTSDCFNFRGPFAKILRDNPQTKAREIRDGIVEDLRLIVRSFDLAALCFVGVMPDYRAVLSEPYSEYVFQNDPYLHAYEALLYNVSALVCDGVSEPVAFVVDDHSKALQLLARWPEIKRNSPKASPCMGTLAPLDDRMTPALQMADLLSNSTKRALENCYPDKWDEGIKQLERLVGKNNLQWVAGWNQNYLRALRDVSIDVATGPVPE